MKSKRKLNIKSSLRYIILSLFTVLFLFPVYWMFIMSLKPPAEWRGIVTWLPSKVELQNYYFFLVPEWVTYGFYIKTIPIYNALINTLINTLGGTLLSVCIGALAAYGISRYKLGGDFMAYLVLLFRVNPPIAIIVPFMIWYSILGLIDTHLGMILYYTLATLPLSVWILKSFFDEIPKEIEEASQIDGCSPFQSFLNISLPLAKNGLLATFILIFIFTWSDYLGALVLTRERAYTLTIYLGRFYAESGVLLGPLAACGVFTAVPIVLLGLFAQKYLIRGLTLGALKE